jgi:hypothetical protein
MDMGVTQQNDPCKSRWAYLLGQLGGDNDEHAALRAVVRGERPLDSIITTIAEAPAVERVRPPRVSLCAADLAEGIMNLKNDPAALSEWAGFILATFELFAFEDEQSGCWDRLFSWIWSLAFGARLGNPEFAFASAIRQQRHLA